MKSVLVVGGGRQGSLVARDLLDSGYEVVVADKIRRNEDIPFVEADITTPAWFKRMLYEASAAGGGYNLVVCTLPAEFSVPCVQGAAEYGVDCVDLSFTTYDFRKFDKTAKITGCTVLADCGIAPGLSNLLVGHLLNKHPDAELAAIYVGGISKNPNRNDLGYVPSWSIPDLCSEYTRQARILVNRKIVTLPAPLYQPTHDLEIVKTPIGELEAFYSDGVRSLLSIPVPAVIEKTLRWPGHLKKVQNAAAVRSYNLASYDLASLKKAFSSLEPGTDDVVIMRVYVEGASYRDQYDLVCYGDDIHTAMARATAHSCAAFAKLVLIGVVDSGVWYPEDLTMSIDLSLELLVETELRKRDIHINRHEEVL